MARSRRRRVVVEKAAAGERAGEEFKRMEKILARLDELERFVPGYRDRHRPEGVPYDEEKDRGWRQRSGDEGAAKTLRRQTVEMLKLEGLLQEARWLFLTPNGPGWQSRRTQFLDATEWLEEGA